MENGESLSKKYKADTEPMCDKHNHTYLFWCQGHHTLLCKQCIPKDHKNCNFDVIEDSIKDIKEQINEETDRLEEDIDNDIHSFKKLCGRLQNTAAKLQTLVNVIQKQLEKISQCQNEVSLYMNNRAADYVRVTEIRSLQKDIDSLADLELIVHGFRLARNSSKLKKVEDPTTKGVLFIIADSIKVRCCFTNNI